MSRSLRTGFILLGLVALSGRQNAAGASSCTTDADCPPIECLVARCLNVDTVGDCVYDPASPGTPCGDPSSTDCDEADTCNGSGDCQPNYVDAGRPCTDTDDNACTVALCTGSGFCQQDAVEPFGIPCPDTDGNVCTEAACDGSGSCNQTADFPFGTPCPDTGNECLDNVCDGSGQCGRARIGDGCTDTDGNVCTVALCTGGGSCRQDAVEPFGIPCPDTDDNACTESACDGSGSCNQTADFPFGTPCPDTGNECLDNVCDGSGQCGRARIGDGCTDTDGKVCTVALCTGGGFCQQDAVDTLGVPCPDTDDNACTESACDGGGNCDQQAGLLTGNPCDDGDACTEDDTCQTGTCVAGPPLICDDSDPCTIDRCENGACVCGADPACAPQGCTPGYWKNNATSKSANAWPAPYTPGTRIRDVFTIPDCVGGPSGSLGSSTLSRGLSFKGGSSFNGTAQMLLRSAIAALLNSASLCVQYPLCPNEVIDRVNAALASCNRRTMLSQTRQLDDFNSLFCPLNQQGVCLNP